MKLDAFKRITDRKVHHCVCVECQKSFIAKRATRGMFCSCACSYEYKKKDFIKQWKSGEIKGWSGSTAVLSPAIRTYLKETRGNLCSKCGWAEINPTSGRIPLEINHINGDAHDNREENLEILCPNCHSLTSNYKYLNKNNSSRTRRKLSRAGEVAPVDSQTR